MKSYKYTLFDWDGTLVTSLDVWFDCLKQQLVEHGYSLSDKQIGANYEHFRKRAPSLGVANVDKIISLATQSIDEHMKKVELCDGAHELLTALNGAGIKIALVTTSKHSQVDHLLDKFHLKNIFSAVVCSDDVSHQKPDAESAKLALKLLAGAVDHAVMIGDSATDIIFSKNSALDSILVHPPNYDIFYELSELQNLKPTYVVSGLRDILGLFN